MRMARKVAVTVNLEQDQAAYLDDREEPLSELVREAVDQAYGEDL